MGKGDGGIGFPNSRQYERHLALYLLIGKPNNSEIAKPQYLFPMQIKFDPTIVDRPIYFDDQSGIKAEKINDETIDNLLPTEVTAVEASCPQLLPEQCFRGGHLTSEVACKVPLFR